MDFHLQFQIPPFSLKLNYSDKLLFIGSCFSENIGEMMTRYKLDAVVNSTGIVYDPFSISKALHSCINNKKLIEKDLFYANDCWHSAQHHSKFSDPDKQECLTKINSSSAIAHSRIKNADWLFITFGSAFYYVSNETNEIVANCHKLPQKEFTKKLSSSAEIIIEYNNLIGELKKINPDLKIIFTVSPVRYIRDGVMENNLSKAVLIQAVHELVKQNENCFYFPAYELVIDDLRDYRFYKKDMVHPNEQAIEYVFERLRTTLFSDHAKIIFEKIKEIVSAKEHIAFNENSEAHKKFREAYSKKCSELKSENSFLDLEQEIFFFRNK